MSDYTKRLQKHLAAYKASRLSVRESGEFNGRPYAHILPPSLKWLNILEPYRAEVRAFVENRQVKLHKYFHHLNSSQAFALNLFHPFFEADPTQAPVLIRALQANGTFSQWVPELIPDERENTNVDVAWQDNSGAWTYCEVKLSEQEFGQARPDKRHLEKLAGIYGPVLGRFCPAALLEPREFFSKYQIMRNVWLAARDPGAKVVFLLPQMNDGLWGPLRGVIDSLDPGLAKRINVKAMEEVLDALTLGRGISAKGAWYVEMLREKYCLP